MPAREAHTYPPFLKRMIRAYGRQVAQSDPVDFAAMVEVRDYLDAYCREVARTMQETHSWTDIADALGVTRQAARQRWGIK